MSISQATLIVRLDVLVGNWQRLAERAAPARCGAVVKADAYGLGAVEVVRALLVAGCRDFYVALVEEGIRLRQALAESWPADARILVLHGPLQGAEGDCLAHRLVPILNTLNQIERWQALAKKVGKPLSAGLQVDTGMARLGLSPADLQHLVDDPSRLDGIHASFVMSHLASAEVPDDPLNALQLQRFNSIRQRWPQAAACLANSSAIFLDKAFHLDMVRPGAALYGVAPTVGAPNPMWPVIRLQARLLQWRDIPAGEGVGYNHAWRSERPTRIGTLSVGYADGWLRSLGGRGHVSLVGRQYPIVGRVSMDTVTVDLTDLPDSALLPGAHFDLIDSTHDINAVANEAGTNAYEILTSLGARYERIYIT